ncbi:MAG TPA: AAA family ATPase [Acidothermaceae bacterium]|nr:AAA family ATPase [Acidothermaceae bacterium]
MAASVMMAGVPLDPRTAPLIGRVDELRTLCELVGLGPTAGGAVVLGGDAGAGKSRLVAELSERARLQGWRVLVGHCLDFGDSSPPYLPFSEALGRLAADSPDEADSLLAASPAIARLLPAQRLLTESDHVMEPTGRTALYDALHGALTQLSAATPLLLIVEDVHWADQSTRDLLRFMFARQFTSRTAILATYRTDDLHRSHPLRAALAEWTRLPAVSRLQLAPLTDAESRQLVRALHGRAIPEPELQRILTRAEGNPFFLEELVAAATVGGALPTDLANLLLVRLEQIGDDGRLVVRAASVAGRSVSHELLARGAELDDATLDAAVRVAVEANILVPLGGDGYGFRHALLAEAVYQDLLPGERVRLHAAYAAALASHQVEGSAAELSRHARASHDLITATRASIEAGDEAMTVGGPEDALHHYELALELLGDPHVAAGVAADPDAPTRVTLVVRASLAAAAAGHPYRAIALSEDELAGLPADAPKLARVRLIHAIVSTALILDTNLDLLGMTTEAMQLMADEPPSSMRAHILNIHARANADRARDDEAIRWATEALAIAQSLQLAEVATDATLLLARLDERAGNPDAAKVAMTKAIAEAAAAGEHMAELRGLYNLASLDYGQGRLTQALSLYQQAAAKARDSGRPWAQYGLEATVIGAIVAYVAGDWQLVEQMIDSSGQNPPEQAQTMLDAVAIEIAAGRGDVSWLDVLPRLRNWWLRDGLIAITSGGAAIELYGYLGDIDAAIATHTEVVTSVARIWQNMIFGARVRLAALLLGQLANAASTATVAEREQLVRRGDELARKALEVAASVRHNGPEGRAWASRVVAENARLHWLGGGAQSTPEADLIEAWQESVSAFDAFGHVYETARSRARLAAVQHAAGNIAEAKAESEAAREVAERLGAQPLLRELRGLTGYDGAAVRPVAKREAQALTPREQEVLTLVATGRSNRDIAQQLFISAKTVSVHISNVLAKLEATSRTEAVAVARRRGLLG